LKANKFDGYLPGATRAGKPLKYHRGWLLTVRNSNFTSQFEIIDGFYSRKGKIPSIQEEGNGTEKEQDSQELKFNNQDEARNNRSP